MVAEFIAKKIMEARDISLLDGQAKYRAYFVKIPTLYGKWKLDVDTILISDGYDDCIVTI